MGRATKTTLRDKARLARYDLPIINIPTTRNHWRSKVLLADIEAHKANGCLANIVLRKVTYRCTLRAPGLAPSSPEARRITYGGMMGRGKKM